MSKVRIGIIGSRFQAECIAGAVNAMPEEGEVVAVASPSKGHAAGFAKRHGIPHAYTDYRELLRDPQDRKSTRLNSSHGYISYAVFCLKKKKTIIGILYMKC